MSIANLPGTDSLPDPAQLGVAGGLPEANWLEALANQFFQAVPGSTTSTSGLAGLHGASTSSPASAIPAGLPAGTTSIAGAGLPVSPAALPSTALNPLPDLASTSATPPIVGYETINPGWPDQGGLTLPSVFPFSATTGIPATPFDGLLNDADLLGLLEASVASVPALSLASAHAPAHVPTHLPVSSTGLVSSTPSFYFLEHAHSSNESVQIPGRSAVVPGIASSQAPFDVNLIRRDFPILQERVNGRQLIWLDNAATTQKPQSVIDRVSYFYEHENSNIHRAAHELAARATDAYEGAREKVRGFLNARSVNEIVFVRGTTEAINLVAKSWGGQNLKEGDEIIVSHLEHHANIVPWQQIAAEKGAKIRVIPVDDTGQILLDAYEKLFNSRTKLVSFTQVSNALGTVTPAAEIIGIAHKHGVKVLLDGAQSVSHMRVDLQALNPDFFVFSGHKVFGPTGIGVLYGREELLNSMPPWQGGGNMIKDVSFEHTEYHAAPGRFEAGTGNIADAVGLGAAIDYVTRLGMDNIALYEHGLLEYATHHLRQIPGLRLIGTAADKASVLSFVLEGHKTEEVGSALNQDGIAVRSGHHCAQPILRRFGLEATVRPSLAFYNTCAEIDALVASIRRIQRK